MGAIENSHWFIRPSKKHLVIFTVIWFICVLIILLDMTDLFTQSFVNRSHLFTYFVLLFFASFFIKVYSNYFKNKRT